MAASFCAKIAKEVEGVEDFDELYDVPFDVVGPVKKCGGNLNILILNTPCNGFGDLVFAWKLAKILRSVYGAKVTVATTLADSLMVLGEDSQNVLRLASSASASEKNKSQTSCRRYTRLKLFKGSKPVDTSQFDVFLDAPVMADFEPDIAGVRKLVPKATYFNTFFLCRFP